MKPLVWRLALQQLEQLGAGHRLVGDHERALDVVALGVEVHDHVLHRAPRGAPDAVDETSRSQPEPSRMRRDDDLVGLLLAEGVDDSRVRIGSMTAPSASMPASQQRQRHAQPVLGRLAHHRVVDHVAVARLVLRADHV